MRFFSSLIVLTAIISGSAVAVVIENYAERSAARGGRR